VSSLRDAWEEHGAGLLIERLREPALTESGMVGERSGRWQRVPMFLHARAVKPG
jgi:hypothetical protein